MIPCVAFLRGINVGGKNLLRMADLKNCFQDLGFWDVETLIQSGNVLYRTNEADLGAQEARIRAHLLQALGYGEPVMVRDLLGMRRVVEALPPSWENGEWKVNVIFLDRSIDRPQILQELRPKPHIDDIRYVPGALLWAARLDALTRSSMVKLSSSPLYGQMSARNLNTTRRVLEILERLAGEGPGPATPPCTSTRA